jgi:hypothetical protein
MLFKLPATLRGQRLSSSSVTPNANADERITTSIAS